MGGIRNPSDNPEPRWHDPYAEGYKAGRIAALRELNDTFKAWKPGKGIGPLYTMGSSDALESCRNEVCRLLAEAESGEQVREVGDDR